MVRVFGSVILNTKRGRSFLAFRPFRRYLNRVKHPKQFGIVTLKYKNIYICKTQTC